ncbi:MAG: Biopolymer transport protein ExbD/TolR [Planctomycetes bacterium ADurb.Bin126]|nr:MAG: Biopolymer transport protein ExbD/TolR [Planctomycetes bacterium ADurb.Bin126]HOD82842.1 biopolymer transporter ExbD [Phycisphaerae bacterium]HQL75552.1 biopolymer transporter ExbD [Phycisphaerae bacterium]
MAAHTKKKVQGDETVHYEPPRKKRTSEQKAMQPPMTPMIDVTFQLLIFFILTSTFRQAEGQIPGSLPKQGQGGVSAEEKLDRPINITIYPAGVDSVAYEIEGLPQRLSDAGQLYQHLMGRQQAVGAQGTKIPVVIKPLGSVQWRWVTEAFNQSVRAKFENVGFATSS